MKSFLKILKWTGIVILVLGLGLFLFVQFSWDKTYDTAFPEIVAATDSASIAHGAYLCNGPAHCNACHLPKDKLEAFVLGEKVPISGGLEFDFPGFGVFRTPNISSDPETGIGKLTDTEIARAIRYGVSHKGKVMVPFMNMNGLSDYDLSAIIGYLRSLEPVKLEVQGHEYGFMAKALMAFGMFKPKGPDSEPPKRILQDTTAEYGSYLANNVSACKGCHTQADMTGAFIGEPFAGKGAFPADKLSKGYSFLSPNLTPDQESGVIASWTEDLFIARFKKGRTAEGSPMPWESYSRMSDNDLKAIYRYLNSLEPVSNTIEKTIFLPGEELPKT